MVSEYQAFADAYPHRAPRVVIHDAEIAKAIEIARELAAEMMGTLDLTVDMSGFIDALLPRLMPKLMPLVVQGICNSSGYLNQLVQAAMPYIQDAAAQAARSQTNTFGTPGPTRR